MRIKGSAAKERCQFCFRDDLITEYKTKRGTKVCHCHCGYKWVKETWQEMLTRTGKVWDGHKYKSDYDEENQWD